MATYTFSDIILINKSLKSVRNTGKEFPFVLSKLISDNITKTDKIIDEHNIKLNELTEKYGVLDDNSDLVIQDDKLIDFNQELETLYKQEFTNIENIYMREIKFKDEYKNLFVSVEILDLLKPIIIN